MTFDQLYYKHAAALCYFANRIVKDKEVAQDIVSEVFIKVWQKKYDLPDGDMQAILYTSVKNQCLDYFKICKRDRKRLNIVPVDVIPDTQSEEIPVFHYQMEAEILADLMRSIDLLPGKCKDVFIMTFVKHYSTATIADKLGISKQNVLNQKQRAVQLLRICVFNPQQHEYAKKPWYNERIK